MAKKLILAGAVLAAVGLILWPMNIGCILLVAGMSSLVGSQAVLNAEDDAEAED